MNKTPFEKAGDFLLGRGFYIVLFLCVATIGFSGYYLISSLTPSSSGNTISPVAATPEITIPDPIPVIVTPAEVSETVPEVTVSEPTEESLTQSIELQEVELEAEVVETAPISESVSQIETVSAVYTWPVKGDIIRDFSVDTLSRDTTMGDWRTHTAIDIAAALGTSVLAPSRGTVLSVEQDDMMGTTVVIQHLDGVISTLSNLATVAVVKQGDTVETGTVIGAVGDTALAESSLQPHLHLEMSQDGQPINPIDLLP